MKAWTTAPFSGVCAYDFGHTWLKGARIFVVQGVGWRKAYCPSCAARHKAPPDTGEILDVTDQPTYPKPLKPLAEQTRRKLFDPKMAAAGRDE